MTRSVGAFWFTKQLNLVKVLEFWGGRGGWVGVG